MDTPEYWSRQGNWLQELLMETIQSSRERHDIGAHIKDWTAMTEHYFAEEFLFRSEVDKAVDEATAHGRLPKAISPAARYYLCIRIQAALDFLGMIHPPLAKSAPFGDIPDDWAAVDAARWLLKDLWIRRFDHWLKLTAIGNMGPFAFYGIDPADPSKFE